MQIILASKSPRRKELMELFRLPFSVTVADADETMDSAGLPRDEVAKVSLRKAQAIPRAEEDLVIAADTIVVCDGNILGKPADDQDAFRMLSMLSGRTHQVMTGLTVLMGKRSFTHTEITDVRFRTLTESEIRRYIASGDPMDKAGSYGIQSGAALFVEQICGDYYNVVGLPVCRLQQILAKLIPEQMEEIQ